MTAKSRRGLASAIVSTHGIDGQRADELFAFRCQTNRNPYDAESKNLELEKPKAKRRSEPRLVFINTISNRIDQSRDQSRCGSELESGRVSDFSALSLAEQNSLRTQLQ
jgi:hypothetical protein